MFNLAIDSKLRGCDVVAIKVDDVAAGGYAADRATVCRKDRSTGRFELSEQTGQAVDDYLKATNKKPGVFLFAGRPGHRGAAARDRGGTGKSGKRGSGDDRDHD